MSWLDMGQSGGDSRMTQHYETISPWKFLVGALCLLALLPVIYIRERARLPKACRDCGYADCSCHWHD